MLDPGRQKVSNDRPARVLGSIAVIDAVINASLEKENEEEKTMLCAW